MSSEGKKKRGESGKKNAETIPFRNGGRPCNYSTSLGRAERFAGSQFLNAMILGIMLPGYSMSQRAENAAEAAMDRCSKVGRMDDE